MAFKLSKAQLQRRDKLIDDLRGARGKLVDVVAVTNAEIQRLVGDDLTPAIEAYNALLEQARAFVEELGTDFRSEFDDKSEGWQEGERGQAADEFIGAFENVSFDDVELPQVEEIAIDENDEAVMLEELPEGVEQ